jgi:hypothetical protein
MPMGDATRRPPPRTDFPATTLPNATSFAMPKPHKVEAGKDEIRCFPIDPELTEDTWISATNVVPGDPRVVHHVIVYSDPKKAGPSKVDESGDSYKCFGGPHLGNDTSVLLAWAPGVPPTGFSNIDAGIKIPKGANLVLQVHYHPISATVLDQTKFEVVKIPKEKSPPAYVAEVQLAGNARDAEGTNVGKRVKLLSGPDDPDGVPTFLIPKNATAHTEKMTMSAPSELALMEAAGYEPARFGLVGAHMHWAGTNMTLKTKRAKPRPGQPENECLLSTPKYDFNWQRGYAFDEPWAQLPTLQAGDELTLECTYDNSMANENVAKSRTQEGRPVADLHLGETTDDEMCLAALVILRPYVSFRDE